LKILLALKSGLSNHKVHKVELQKRSFDHKGRKEKTPL